MRTSPQLDIAPRRALARASDLERARSRTSDLARALANARSSALAFKHVEILDEDRVLDRASALALDITPGTVDLDRAHSRASDLVSVLDRAFSQACGWEGTINQVRGLASELVSELISARTLYDEGFRAAVLTYERARLERARHDLPNARDLTRNLEHARDLTRDLIRDLTRAATEQHGAEQVVPLAGHLLSVAPRLLPASDRARYAEEFRSELSEIARAGARRRAQIVHATRVVMSAWRVRAELRVAQRRKAAP